MIFVTLYIPTLSLLLILIEKYGTIKTRFKLPTHYVDGLRPNKPKSNEFVEYGSEILGFN